MITRMIRTLRSLSCAVAALTFLAASLSAQDSQAVVPNRITGPIDNDQLVTLHGNVSPFANAKNDHGPVSASLPMPDLTLVLSRSPEQQAAFDQYIASEYDPNSSNYHQWLTPNEIGERFGPSEGDIATLANWLSSQGFTVKQVTPDRMAIRFSGTAGLAESAFHTRIDNLVVRGVPHIGNMSDPSIPAALAPVVVGIKALHNFLPHPMHIGGNKVEFNRQLGGWQRIVNSSPQTSGAAASLFSFASSAAAGRSAALNSARPHPLFGINVPGSSTSSAYLEEDVTPWDFATIYNVAPLWDDSINGTGQTIAIAGTSDIDLSDVATFRSTFGLPAGSTPKEIDTNGLATECTSTSSTAVCGIGDLEENTIDVEWSGAVAPDAQIDLVVTGQNPTGTVDSVYDSAQYVVQNLTARILNVSYGECELGQGTAENVAYYDLWQSAAAEGISVFVAAGDSGSPSCDDGGDAIGNPYSAQYGLSVSGIASTPFNVAVGGTDFSWCKPTLNSSGDVVGCPLSSSSQGSPAYWNTSNQSTTSTEPYESAAGYVPEIPWNDTCENPLLANYLNSIAPLVGVTAPTNAEGACNFVQDYWESIYESDGVMLAPYVDTVGGSGGASNCVANTENTDPDNPTCTTSATTTGAANGSIALTNDGWQKPSWQSDVTGIPNDGVRDLPDVSFFAGDGALDSAYLVCISPAGANCNSLSTTQQTEPFAYEFGGTSFASPAMAGVMALINQKAGAPQGLPNAQLYKLASQQDYADCSAEASASSTASCYFHSIDEGTNSMPCDLGAPVGGAVYDPETGEWEPSQEYEGIVSPNCTALNSGDTVGTLVSSGTTPAYNASTGFNLATGLGSLNVANVVNAWTSTAGTATATLAITTTPAASSGTITLGSGVSLVIAATVTGSGTLGTPTGSITVAGGGYSTSQSLSSGAATITIPAGSLAPGTDTLTISYSGDQNYASTSQTETVDAAASTPTVTVLAPASDNVANSINVTVTVSGPSAGSSTPTGTVTLASGSYSSTAATLSSAGTASILIPANALAVGTDTLTATYSGNTTYAGATGTAGIVIVSTSAATPTVNVTPSSTTIDSSQSLNVTVAVSGSSSVPTGYVTLTSGSYNSGLTALSGGSATISIAANTLGAGADVLTATYSGDSVYASAASTATVTVTQSTYSLSATTPAAVSPGGTATSTITGQNSSTGYTGTVTLNSCSLTSSSVSNPNDPPSCSVSGDITFTNGTASGSGTATVSTTAATTLVHQSPSRAGWSGVGGGAVLALLVFLGLPKRRRNWLAMLGMLVALAGLGGLSGCGGGSGTTLNLNGTSAGTYTFAVAGTGNDPATTAESTTFTVTVN